MKKTLSRTFVAALASLLFLVLSPAAKAEGLFQDKSVSPYLYMAVPHDRIDEFMTIGSAETETPLPLQGLWWMDGNPLPEEVVSFAGTRFERRVSESGEISHHGLVYLYDEGIYSLLESVGGKILHKAFYFTKMMYDVEFDENFENGQVTPSFNLPVGKRFSIPPSKLVDFQLVSVSRQPDTAEFARKSFIAGKESSYRFRRIVDGEGKRLKAWGDFLESIADRGNKRALLPICQKETGNSLPTSCVLIR